ncbi:MAG: PVC-type heme-binding CxxCH protein [bacterium]
MNKINLACLSLAIALIGTSCKNEVAITKDPLGLYLPDDLKVELWAESPMFYNPTNMDMDVRGRIWMTEAVNYRNFNNDSIASLHRINGDRVVILEDRNHDGKADTSIVFVEDRDLVSPLGIAVVGNKVIVSCSPNLIVYTDENGDDKADKKEVLLTGFGGLDHDHALHSGVFGPDGKLYFNVGNAGPHVVKDKSGWTLRSGSMYTGGTPYNPTNEGNQKSDDGKVWVGGLQLRVNPDGTGLAVLGHGFRNSYETAIDSYGDMWQSDNDDGVVTCRVSWLMEGGNAGFFSSDGTRSWQADQRPDQNMFTAHWRQEDPGVIPVGDNSGAGAPTGIVLNEGDGLGEKYRGMLMSADAGRNVIFGYKPELSGAGFNLSGKRQNFISSLQFDNQGYVWYDALNDTDTTKWFRPSDVMIGTDGAMYIADWYDPVVGGHQRKDNKGHGRIYRISPKNKKLETPIIDLNTIEGQIEALKNPAINVRHEGFERLKNQGEKALEPVKALMNSENPYHHARAIGLMAQLGKKGQDEVYSLLYNKDPRIAGAAMRSLRKVYTPDQMADLIDQFLLTTMDPRRPKLADGEVWPSLFLQREIAIALRDLPLKRKKGALMSIIAGFDGKDPFLLETIGQALENDAEAIWPELHFMFREKNNGSPEKWTEAYSQLLWRLHPSSAVYILKGWANSNELPEANRKKAITALGFVNDKSAAEAMLALSKSDLKDVSEQASYWLSFRQGNDWMAYLDWKNIGIDLGREKKKAEMKAAKERILNKHIVFDDRKYTAEIMAKDSVGGQLIIGMLADKTFPVDLDSVVKTVIFTNPDQSVRTQAGNYFERAAGKKYVLSDITKIKPDAAKGKQVYTQQCATCHRAGDQGGEIGPDLTLINKKFDRESLLDAIINPSAAIVFGYEPWLINTKDGETFFGFLLSDGKTVLLKDAIGKRHSILKENIKSREKMAKSLMPEPSAMGLSSEDLANVAEFLLTMK